MEGWRLKGKSMSNSHAHPNLPVGSAERPLIATLGIDRDVVNIVPVCQYTQHGMP